MRSGKDDWGLPSRVSAFGDPRINARLPASRGLSQAAASFVASRCQDIRRTPFLSLATPTDRRTNPRARELYRRLPHHPDAPSRECRGRVAPADRASRRPHDSPKRCPTTPPTAGPPDGALPPDGKTVTRAGAGGTHAHSGGCLHSGRRRGFTRNSRPTTCSRRHVPYSTRLGTLRPRGSLANKP